MADDIEQTAEDVQTDAPAQEEPNEQVSEYQRIVEEQSKQIGQLTEHVNSLTAQIGQLIKSGAQINTSARQSEGTFTTDPSQSSFYNPHKDVKPLSDLNFT